MNSIEAVSAVIDACRTTSSIRPPARPSTRCSFPPPLMEELVAWLNAPADIHPVLVSGLAQFQLVHIHPFVDGNGRTSRLLSTLALYRAGYDFKRLFTISEFYDRDRLAFYAAIQGVRDQGMDFTGWLEFFIDGLATQLDEVKERGQRVILRDVLVKKHRLNERQALILDRLETEGMLSIQMLETSFPEPNRRTLQRDLKGLIACGQVVSEGATNRAKYRLCQWFGNLRQTCDTTHDKLAT